MTNLWKRGLSLVLALVMIIGMAPMQVFADETETTPPETQESSTEAATESVAQIAEETPPTEGYKLTIYNADGTEGMVVDGTKSASDFCMKSAIEDARVFANNAFLFGLTTPCTYVVEMYEDSTENASFEIGADVTINGNGHKIVCAEGVTVTNNGTLNNAEIVVPAPAVVEVATYDELVAALANGGEIKLTADITVDTRITAIDDTVIDLNGKTLYINVEDSAYGNVTIKNGNIVLGKDDVHVCNGYFLVNEGKSLVVNCVNVTSADGGIKGYAVFHLKTGANLDLIDSTLSIGQNEFSAGYVVYAGESTATVDVTRTTLTVAGNGIVHATTKIENSTISIEAVEHGINRSGVTIEDSVVTISGGTGRGITAQHGDLVITGNSKVTISEMGEATIELRNDKNLSVAEEAEVTVDVAVNNTTSGTITGDVTVDTTIGAAAVIGTQGYTTLADAIAAAQDGDVIELMAGTIEEGTIKLPATWKNITIKGAADKTSILKDMTIMASDGNNFSYIGLTFDGITFDNSRLVFTGWRNGEEVIENLTITNCVFKNLHDNTNNAAVHINKDVSEPVNGFTFTNNVIDGATGGSKSGIYTVNTGKVTITGNIFNNIVFRPALVQLADCDGVADDVVISDNTISNTTRLQVYGSEADDEMTPIGTDTLKIAINENVFKNITGYYICTWGIKGTSDITKNYYDSEDLSGKIYWNNIKPADAAGLAEIGVYPYYKNEDKTELVEAPKTYVAEVNGEKFETLQAAIDAAANGDIVTLLADVTIAAGETVALNGINLDAGSFKLTNNGTITVSGASKLNLKSFSGNAVELRGATLTDSYIGGAVNAFGTNAITGDTTITGVLSVGYNGEHTEQVVVTITGNFIGGNVLVSYMDGCDHVLKVGDANGERTTANFTVQLGCFGDVEINNADVKYKYAFIRNDFTATNSTVAATSVNTYVAGNAKVVLDNSSWSMGAYANIGSYGGYMYGNADVTLKNGSTLTATNLGIEVQAGKNVKVTLEDSSSMTVTKLTNQGTIVLAGVDAKVNANECGNVTTDVADYKVVYADGEYKLVAKVYAAQIGGQKYESLQAAIEAVQEGETITLLDNVTVTQAAYGQNALNHARAVSFTLDLNGYTLSADTGNSVVRFNLNGSGATADVTMTIKNGKIVSGANTWCAVMAAGIEGAKAVMNLEDLVIESSKPGDLAVKAWGGSLINAKNVTVNATKGAGGFYAVGGEIVLDNCTVNQTGLHTAPYLSMAVAVSDGGKLTVNSGTYSAVPTAAAEGANQGTSHGSWCGGVMSSGGTMVINGGTFSNGNVGGTASNPRELFIVGADADYGNNVSGNVIINGGTFNSIGDLIHCETIWGSENDAANTYMPTMSVTITGGDFTGVKGKAIGGCDPISTGNPVEVVIIGGTYKDTSVEAYLTEDYELQYKSGKFTVKALPVASVDGVDYTSLKEAIEAANATGAKLILKRDVTLHDTLVIPADYSVVLDLKTYTISQSKACTAHYAMIENNGSLTITGSGKISFTDTGAGDPNFGWGSYTINNRGTLVVKGGTIEHLGEQAFATHMICAIQQAGGTVTIDGGNISTPAYRSIRVNSGTLNITAGIFDGQVWVQPFADGIELNISGGNFGPNGGDASAVFVSNSSKKVALKVTDGTFNGKIGASNADALAGAVTGGVFADTNTNVTLLKEGYIFGENGNGTYGLVRGLRGSGTKEDPYLIKTAEDLILFRDSVNAGETKYNASGMYFVQTADIDLAGINWVGIGSAYKNHGFMGNFDGNGFKIKNLTINNPAVDSDGYAYAGLFAVTEGIDKVNQNTIKNLIIENVTISTSGHIVAAAIAYPYYTIVENVTVCGDINITGGDYTAGALAYTRRCVNASNVTVTGNAGSTITGARVVGGVISDIQMNGGLIANYANFSVEKVTITGTEMVGGISGIIATQTLNGAIVKDVVLNCSGARVGIIAGAFGGTSTITGVEYANVTGATAIIGGCYDHGAPVEAKIGDTYYATLQNAIDAAANGDTITLLADFETSETYTVPAGKQINIDLNGKTISGVCNAGQASLVYIENGASLIIDDSSDAKTGKITYAAGTSNVGWAVDVKGALTLESGTIELTGSWSIGYAVDVRPNAWGTAYTKPTVFTMNGGKLVSSDGAVRVASSSHEGFENVSASFVMNGGEIDAAWDGVFIQQSDATYDDLSFVMNGGTIESDLNPIRVYGPVPTGYVNDKDCMTITLNAGTLNYTGSEAQEWVVKNILRVGGGSSVDTIIENGGLTVAAAFAETAVSTDYKWVDAGNGMYKLAAKVYVAQIGDAKFETVAEALAHAKDAGLTEVVITLLDANSKANAITLDDSFYLYGQKAFDKVTFKQADASKVYYIAGIYTGSRTNGGQFVFDGVNIVVIDQYIFEGNVVLTNNSIIKSVAEANCFIYNGETTIEPGSVLQGVIEDFRGGDMIIDGGKTDGSYNTAPSFQDAIIIINWSGDKLVLKNGAYAKINSANEIGRLTINAGAAVEMFASKLETVEYIAVNGTLQMDLKSLVSTKKITGDGKIVIDATGFAAGSKTVIAGDLTGYTGEIEVIGAAYEITDAGLVIKTAVASVNGTLYTSVLEAMADAIEDGASEVKILTDVREKLTADTEWILNENLTITADKAVVVDFYNDGTSYDIVINSNNNNTFTIDKNVTMTLKDRLFWLGYYGNNVDVIVKGTLEGSQIWHGADTTVTSTGKLISSGEAFVLRRGATLTVDGGTIEANYFSILSGNIDAKNATITSGPIWVGNTDNYDNEGGVSLKLDNTTWTSSGNLKLASEATATLELTNGSTVTTVGAAVIDQNSGVIADSTSECTASSKSVFVAEVGGYKYTSLQDAIDAAGEGAVITVLDNITLTEGVEVPADKTVVLNLNGKTITGTPVEAKAFAVITNKGDLTITGNGAIVCDHKLAGSTAYAVNTITNGGKLTVESGTIENKSTATHQIGYAIDNNSGNADAIVVVKGGKVVASGSNYYDGIRLFANSTTNENSVTVEGGEVSTIWMQNPSGSNAKDVVGSVTITDGSVGKLYLEPSSKFEAAITGGYVDTVSKNESDASRDLTGFITGGIFSDASVINLLADGYTLKPVGDKYTPVLDAVAKVNGKEYATLQAAIDAAQAGETIYVLKDIELVAPVVVPADKAITLDLAGSTISYTTDVAGEAMITNNGDLTITGNGTITFAYVGAPDSAYSKGNYTIANSGKLTVENGTIANTTAKMSHAYYTIQNGGNGQVIINGGKIINETSYAIRQFASGNATNTVTVNGGEVIGTRAVWMQAAGSNTADAPAIILNVKGGTLTGTGESAEYKLAVYSYSYGNSMENMEVNVSAGTINGDIALTGGSNKTAVESVNISGGTITGIVESYAADEVAVPAISITGGIFGGDFSEKYATDDGYEFVANGDGTYSVEEVAKPVAVVNDVEYMTLQEAVQAADTGDVIELLRDTDEIVIVNKELVIKTNQHDIFLLAPAKGYLYEDGPNDTIVFLHKNSIGIGELGASVAYIDANNDGVRTNEELMPLQVALNKAAPGQIVRMINNLSIPTAAIMIPVDVTLDIQSYALTVKSLIGFKGSSIGATTTTQNRNGGKLFVDPDNIVLAKEAYKHSSGAIILPMWDPSQTAFVFVNAGVVHQMFAVDDNKITYKFTQTAGGYANKVLWKDGASDNELKVLVHLEWIDADGNVAYQDFVYGNKHVSTVAAGDSMYTFVMTGYAAMNIDINTLSVTAMFLTDSGAASTGTTYYAKDVYTAPEG